MAPRRSLPPELFDALAAVRAVELAAQGQDQYRRAIAATSTLVAAACYAGWTPTELAAPLGLTRSGVQQRIKRRIATRAEPRAADAGLEVPRPPTPRVPLRRVPVDERDWFYASEFCALASVSASTLALWRNAGLLPAARRVSVTHFLYHRSDLDRVAGAPQYRNHGIDRSFVLAEIRAGR